MYNSKSLKRPIQITVAFSLFTILLFLFGPYKYPSLNRPQLLSFLLITNVFMYVGFVVGTRYVFTIKQFSKPNRRYKSDTFFGFSVPQILNFLFWIALIDCIPKFVLYTGAYSIGFSELLSRVELFFSSAQDIYVARQSLHSATGIWRYINYFIVLTGPLYWAYTPLAILFWEKLSTIKRIGTVLIWTLFIGQYLTTGTNVGFFDLLITFLAVVIIKSTISNSFQLNKSIKVIIAVIVIFSILFLVFDTVMGSRIGNQYLKGGSLGVYKYTLNENSFVWRHVPNSLKAMTAYLTRYLANSYNAIALSFEVPFRTTFGIGHSWFLLDNMGSYSETLWSRTYNIQIEDSFGFDHYGNWHTAYLWFANDVSYFGVPILFFILFYSFGRAWKRFLDEKDMFCFLRFMLFVKLSYFLSANNQIFQNSDTLIAFWLLTIITCFGKQLSMRNSL